jgi:imidazoleglycerol-phosphate dehydratase
MLRSFAMEAGITLHNVVLKGKNAHHVAEATFKALGLALHQATRPAETLRSTKSKVTWK